MEQNPPEQSATGGQAQEEHTMGDRVRSEKRKSWADEDADTLSAAVTADILDVARDRMGLGGPRLVIEHR